MSSSSTTNTNAPPERRYLQWVLLLSVAVIALVSAALAIQGYRGQLLPAPISNRVSLDAKLRFFRQQPPAPADVWVQGSSFGLNHFVDEAFLNGRGNQIAARNLAAWGLSIEQQWDLLTLFQSAWQSKPSTIILFTQANDFKRCVGAEAVTKERRELAIAQLRASQPKWLLHLRAGRWWHNFWWPKLRDYQAMTATTPNLASLNFTPSGSVPFQLSESRKQHPRWSKAPVRWSSDCLAPFRRYVDNVTALGGRLAVVWLPIRPVLETPDVAANQQALKTSLRESLQSKAEGSRAIFLDATSYRPWSDDDFADGIHLQKRAAAELTRWVAAQLPPNFLAGES